MIAFFFLSGVEVVRFRNISRRTRWLSVPIRIRIRIRNTTQLHAATSGHNIPEISTVIGLLLMIRFATL